MKITPQTDTLIEILSPMVNGNHHPIEILSRREFLEKSTFPVEIITCKKSDGEVVQLFCKFLGGMGPNNFGHRGGVEYEAKVYSEILEKTPCPTIKFYGQSILPGSDETLMVIEYLGDWTRMNYSGDDQALDRVAHWLGVFHRLNEENLLPILTVYDTDYYYDWSVRYESSTVLLREKHPWINELIKFYRNNFHVLLESPLTVIHGELYPKNVLLKNKTIYPIDWESAAFACGEIDIASITEGYEDDYIDRFIATYMEARWPSGNHSEEKLRKRLFLAQIYFLFWWWWKALKESDLESSWFFTHLQDLHAKAMQIEKDV